jgi:hypothetical protein
MGQEVKGVLPVMDDYLAVPNHLKRVAVNHNGGFPVDPNAQQTGDQVALPMSRNHVLILVVLPIRRKAG